ncbi:MAG: RluA family pseudouridine synthase [Bdellovibrionota bacterium]
MDEDLEELRFQYQSSQPLRLDKVLAESFPELDLTRAKSQKMIKAGLISVEGKPALKSSQIIEPGNQLVLKLMATKPSDLKPYNFPLEIIFEDEFLLVVNKPPGLTVHPGAGNQNKTLVNALIHKQITLSKTSSYRPGIIHRLDKDTSGLLVVAKTDAAHAALSDQFKTRTASRIYKALCLLTPRRKTEIGSQGFGVIEGDIGRDPKSRTKMSLDGLHPKSAVTHWKVSQLFYFAALLELKLETGRTHQIRVHMNSIGAPIIGDPTYGSFDLLPNILKNKVIKFGRQALHAESLTFIHPKSAEQLSFSCNPPADFLELITIFKTYDEEFSNI